MTQLDQWFTDYPEWRPYADLIVVPPTGDEIRKEFPDTSEEVVRRAFDTFWSLVSLGTAYLKMRREGISDRFAAMLALQAPPRLKSNVTFLAGRKPWYELADPRYVEKVRKKLAEKGVSLTPQMEYCPELARYTGDPEAVLPHGQERDHIKKICEQRGWACILPDQVIQGSIIGASKSWYSGKAVEIACVSGTRTTVTANHPVVTPVGLSPAGDLSIGQYLLRYIGEHNPDSASDHKQHAPATAEDVFSSLKNISGSVLSDAKLACNPLDFHGEAQFFQGNIETVGSYSELPVDLVSETSQGFGDCDFIRGGSKELGLPRSRRLNSGFHRSPSSRGSGMSGCDLLDPLVGAVLAPAQATCFGAASQIDAVLPKPSGNGCSVRAVPFSQFLESCSGQIIPDKIVEIRVFHYNGPVFDFESPFGWILANGLCISNCEGAVECKHREPDRDPFETAPKMADDLIQNKARLLAHEDPGFRKKSRKEQREAVLAKFGPSS